MRPIKKKIKINQLKKRTAILLKIDLVYVMHTYQISIIQ